jgi:hypothetical protein
MLMLITNNANTHRARVAFCLMILTLADGSSAAQTCEPAASSRAQQDVRAIYQALYGGDADTLLRFTHPTIVELQGGPAAARQTIDNVIASIQKGKMSVESLTFPSPPTCLRAGGRGFIVVPTMSVLSIAGQRVESLNYQFGVAGDGESSWTYIEGSRVNADTVQILFPGFPKGYKFPPIYRKRI